MTIFEKFKEDLPNIEGQLKNKRVAILAGGFSEEREASRYSGDKVYDELAKNGFNLLKIDPVNEGSLDELRKGDVVFNCLHGEFGESGHLQAILDYRAIPYTFSGVYASAVTMNKIYSKSLASKIGFATAPDNFDEKRKNNPEILYIHKKITGGGSIGSYVDNNPSETDTSFFNEEFIPGKILTLGILESKEQYYPLGIVEIKLRDKKFYDQESKYEDGFSSYIPYVGSNEEKIGALAMRLFSLLNIRGGARIDLIESEDGKNLIFLEINTVPGLYAKSNFAYSASLRSLSFYELLLWILSRAQCHKL